MENNDIIETGIEGLDKMLKGGIPSKSQVLIAGGPGAGKTLMCFEILYHNAKKGIPGVFISMEERSEKIIKNAKEAFPNFTDIDQLIESKLLIIDGEDPASKLQGSADSETYVFGSIITDIESVIQQNHAKIVVIDSLSMLSLVLVDEIDYRKSLLLLISNFNRLGITSFSTYELTSSERKDLKFQKDFFIFDGLITLYQSSQEDRRMLLTEIVKMRGVNHSYALVPYEISEDGFKIYSLE